MSRKGSKWLADKASAALRTLPRLTLTNLRPNIKDQWRDPKKRPRDYSRRYGNIHHVVDHHRRAMKHEPIGFAHLVTPVAYRSPVEKSYNYGWS